MTEGEGKLSTQPIIMVQITERSWTLEALHAAAVMARQMSAKVALVQMIPVTHLNTLGTELGYRNFSEAKQHNLVDYESMVEDYGVEFDVQLFQYATLADAIEQAADFVDARIVFATLPRSIFPWWSSFQLRELRRHLAQQQRKLIDQPGFVSTIMPTQRKAA